MELAAQAGKLELLIFLFRKMHKTFESKQAPDGSSALTPNLMDESAANGYLNIAQWLHSQRQQSCTAKAMNKAGPSEQDSMATNLVTTQSRSDFF